MPQHRLAIASTILLAVLMSSSGAFAQDHRGRSGDPTWFDGRHAHDHWYPARGGSVAVVPRGSVDLAWRGGHYFYRAGVWYRPSGPRFVIVAPPPGIIVPVLPPSYATVVVAGVPYYYANGTYYASAPGQGYAVVDPPPGVEAASATDAAAPAYAAPAPATVSSTAPSDPIVYPRNGQSLPQTDRDRGECAQWATGQARGTSGPQVFQRAFDACMDGRGYTVR